MSEFDELAQLVRAPERWPELSDDLLEEAVSLAVGGFGVNDGRFSEQAITPFLNHVIDRLSVERRLRIVVTIGKTLERAGRKFGRARGQGALVPLIHIDPDRRVVSTAALTLAQSISPDPGDAMTGPKQVVQLAERFDGERKGSILGGLAFMGDSRICALVREAWSFCSFETQRVILEMVGKGPPTVAAFEFILDVLELQPADETHFGYAAGGLRMLTRKAAVDVARSQSEPGFLDIERALPDWSSASEDDVIRIKRRYSVAEFVPRVEARLLALAANEAEPKVLPYVLAELGVPVGAG